MPQPTLQQVHVDSALTDIATAYKQNNDNYIADKVFPNVPVQHRTNYYFKWTKDDWFRDEAQIRADGTESQGTGLNLTTGSYACNVYALHTDVGMQVRSNADPAVDLDAAVTEALMQKILIRRDRVFMSTYMATSKWGTDITGVASGPSASQTIYWNDDANGDPYTDIATGRTTILQNTGQEPNILVLGYPVYEALRKHPLVIDRIKYTNPAYAGDITPALLGQSLGVQDVLVSKAVYNSAAEGVTGSYSFVMGKHALLCYRAPSPGLMVPSAGYTFSWSNYLGVNNALGVAAYQMPVPLRGIGTVRNEVEMAFDMQVVGSDLGYFFSGITS